MIDQPSGAFEFCDQRLGAYWQRGVWTRDKLRGRLLRDKLARDEHDIEPHDVFGTEFYTGWLVEEIEHDGEWCDPQWPVYRLVTEEPAAGNAERVSWLEFEQVRQ